jgi:thiol-disulfide isomerase/thioredoxin
MKKITIWTVTVLVVVTGVTAWYLSSASPGKLDDFAKCLDKNGATFYGAFWCPHCQSQKKMFGKSQKHLPYYECSTADGRGQLQGCADAGVSSYPTWEFDDGSRLTGEISLSTLAEKTGCNLPE